MLRLFRSLFYQMWQHDETGRIVELPYWRRPGPRWHLCKWKE